MGETAARTVADVVPSAEVRTEVTVPTASPLTKLVDPVGPVASLSPTRIAAFGSSGTNVKPADPRPVAMPTCPVRRSRTPTPAPGSAPSSTTQLDASACSTRPTSPAPSVTVWSTRIPLPVPTSSVTVQSNPPPGPSAITRAGTIR